MKNLLLLTVLFAMLYSCDAPSPPTGPDTPTEVNENTESPQLAMAPPTATINVHNDSSFMLMADPSENVYKAFFPNSLTETCKSNYNANFNLNKVGEALYFSKLSGDNITITKYTNTNQQHTGYTRQDIGILQNNAGGKLLFCIEGTDFDKPVIYGEDNIRDYTIDHGYGVRLTHDDAYLVYTKLDAKTKGLSLYYKSKILAEVSGSMCEQLQNQDSVLYDITNVNLDSSNCFYTKCGGTSESD